MSNANANTNGNGNRYSQMSDEELARMIFRDEVIRQACEFVALMIVSRRRAGQRNVACEVSVQGRQVSAAYGRETFGTCTVPQSQAVGAGAGASER